MTRTGLCEVEDTWWRIRNTRAQRCEAIGFEERYQYLLHDRDSIFAKRLDESVNRLGIEVLKSPPRCPKANAICERVIGTVNLEGVLGAIATRTIAKRSR